VPEGPSDADRPRPGLRTAATKAAVFSGIGSIPFALALALLSEYGPGDRDFWVITVVATVGGFLLYLPSSWVFERGAEHTGWGRLIVVTLTLVPLQVLYLVVQDSVDDDHFGQLTLLLATAGYVTVLLFLTAFWRHWLPAAQRDDRGAILIVADTAVMLVVLTMAAAAVTAVLEGLGAVTTEPELGARAIWDSEVFFAWHFWDSIPELEIPDTLGWKPPFETRDALGGSLIILYKVLVILPVVAAITDLWRRRSKG
jgi:hypothetical protein